jgi:transcriptional regulator with XRE-family HTH domain
MPRMSGIGDRIKYLMRLNALTQDEFARAVGVSRGAVGNWVRGQPIGRESVARIAEQFGTTHDWLELGRGAPPPRTTQAGSPVPRPANSLQSGLSPSQLRLIQLTVSMTTAEADMLLTIADAVLPHVQAAPPVPPVEEDPAD